MCAFINFFSNSFCIRRYLENGRYYYTDKTQLPMTMPPDVHNSGGKCSPKTDSWYANQLHSFSPLFFFLLTLYMYRLFGGLLWEIFNKGAIWQGDTNVEQPDSCPDQVYELMKKCWQKKPDRRPTCSKILAVLQEAKEKQKGEKKEICLIYSGQ